MLANAAAAATGPAGAERAAGTANHEYVSLRSRTVLDEVVVLVTPSGTGFVDVQVPIGRPGQDAVVSKGPLNPARTLSVSLGQSGDPYVDRTQAHFALFDGAAYGTIDDPKVAFASVEDPSGSAVLRLGIDNDGNGLPSPDEELCVSPATDLLTQCAVLSVGRHWILVSTARAGPTPVVVTRGIVSSRENGYFVDGRAWVSAAGRSDGDGRLAIRWSADAATMPDGGTHLGMINIDLPTESPYGVDRLLVPVRLVRRGSDPPAAALVSNAYAQARMLLARNTPPRAVVFDVPHGTLYMELAVTHPAFVDARFAVWRDPSPDYTGPTIAPAPGVQAPGAQVVTTGTNGHRFFLRDSSGTTLGGRWYLMPVNLESRPEVFNLSAIAQMVDQSLSYEIRPGSYYDPDRPGHGLFLYPAGEVLVLLWYAYDDDGQPTWYYAQGDDPYSGGKRYELDLYRTAWTGGHQVHYEVGRVILVGTADGRFVMTWLLDGRTGSEEFEPFLTGCPTVEGAPLDISAHWFDPSRPGTGYSVQVAPGYEFFAAYLYDELGRPRFLAAERGGSFAADSPDIELHQLRGFGPFAPWKAPVRTPVGSLRRTFSGGALDAVSMQAAFADGLPGEWNVVDAVVPLTATQGCATP